MGSSRAVTKASRKQRRPAVAVVGVPAPSARAAGSFYAAGPALRLSAPVQPKLALGQPGDPFEREADTAAERVVAGSPAPALTPVAPGALGGAQPLAVQRRDQSEPQRDIPAPAAENGAPDEPDLVQRQSSPQTELQPDQYSNDPRLLERQQPAPPDAQPDTGDGSLQMQAAVPQPAEPDEEPAAVQTCSCSGPCSCGGNDGQVPDDAVIQARALTGTGVAGAAHVAQALRSPGTGEPLRPAVRRSIERHIGAGFGDVRVHQGGDEARALGARAFTHGNNIWLGRGESPDNLQLMAHEAAHVVQQGAVDSVPATAHHSGTPLVQRADYAQLDGVDYLFLDVPFGDEFVYQEIRLQADVTTSFAADDRLAQRIEDDLGRIFNPPARPLRETLEYMESPAVTQLIVRGLRQLPTTGRADFTELAGLLNGRTALFYEQNLLPGATKALASALGLDPAAIDWQPLIPALRGEAELVEPTTVIEASVRDRYLMFLDMLAIEASALPLVAGAATIDPVAADEQLQTYLINGGAQLFSAEVFGYHSEKFVGAYVPMLAAIRYVPEGFNQEAFRPSADTSRIDAARERIIDDFIEQEAHGRVITYILDRWTESGESPEGFLSTLDIADFREQLISDLAKELVGRARANPELMAALRSRAADQARFTQVVWMVGLGHGLEEHNAELAGTFLFTPLDELSPEDAAIAADPYAYHETSLRVSGALLSMFNSLTPNGPVEIAAVRAAAAVLQAMDLPSGYAPLFLLPELLGYLAALQRALQEQESATKKALEERLDLDFDDIADTVHRWSDYANTFIEEQWKPMLKQVALEWLEANRAEIQDIYDNLDTADEEFTIRLSESADELDRLAERLEEGSYESIELNGLVITADDTDHLRTTALFLRDEAAARDDPERLDEQREQLSEALDVYKTVKADLENDEYDPLDYAQPVYQEARRRLGISEFDEFTTVGMVLRGDVTAKNNPFLAQAIVGWHWRESVERTIETGLLMGGLMILTLSAMIVPGVGGLILGAIDIGIGVGLGVKGISDANEVLRMARLDPHQDIRGVSVAEAEAALHHAWIGLGVTVLLTVGPLALSRVLRVRGGGIELPPAVRQWEEGLSSETRQLLRENSGLRRVFAEMSPAARRLLTHCSTICIPPMVTDAERLRIETFLSRAQRLRGKTGTFGTEHEWMLREYFYARRNNLGQAIGEIEGVSNLNHLEKKLRIAASERAVALRGAAMRRAGQPTALPPEPTSPIYRHSIDTHGAERLPSENWNRATGGRRRGAGTTLEPQGQWYNDRFVVDAHRGADATNQVSALGTRTVHEFDLPFPAGRVYMPDGRIISDVRRVRVILDNGQFVNAFPIQPGTLPLP